MYHYRYKQEVKDHNLALKITRSMAYRLRVAAAQADMSRSEWIRRKLELALADVESLGNYREYQRDV